MNKKKLLIIIISIFSFIIFSSFVGIFIYKVSPVNANSEKYIKFTVESGWGTTKIIEELKNKNLIRDEFIAKVIMKINEKPMYAGTYKLSKDMSMFEIFDKITNQENIENETVTMTFVEGKRITTYTKQIAEVFDLEEGKILEKLSDKDYLNTLIEKYWFLTKDILKEGIYYPLEGYLYPDTYEFKKNSTIEEIVDKFLTNMLNKLEVYKDEIEISKFTIHEMITLASIVELEGINSADRKGVAGVFYNRIKSGWTLGSDVTTYYAVKKDFTVDLYMSDLKKCNPYNTSARSTCAFSGLPIGPICNAGLSSLASSIDPLEHNYYYFVADKENKTYFNETEVGHNQTVANLKAQNKWYTY